jgi:Fur family ferric uptake transcriptional regulator
MNAAELLSHHHLKKSSARISIIRALQELETPASEPEISNKMGIHYDRTTFYRSIQTMVEAGLIRKIVVDKLVVRYALRDKPDHAHFYCDNCQQLTCLEDIHPGPYRQPAGFQTRESDVIIRGLCNSCSNHLPIETIH